MKIKTIFYNIDSQFVFVVFKLLSLKRNIVTDDFRSVRVSPSSDSVCKFESARIKVLFCFFLFNFVKDFFFLLYCNFLTIYSEKLWLYYLLITDLYDFRYFFLDLLLFFSQHLSLERGSSSF